MKKVIAFMIGILLFASVGTMAHPPAGLQPEFDAENHVLSVEINHGVGGGSSNHFIEEVVVERDGEKIVLQNPGRQITDTPTFLYY
ncbi:hypothetical protein KGY71_04525, partial [Candidatus Bipolaricaulota bacterium]|nr:hypothetical protein [Candidatus Bipolaricaulota bacterium]